MKRGARFALILTVAICACGSQPPRPQGRTLDSQVLASYGPRMTYGAIIAAADLMTLRALVDADAQETVRELGGRLAAHQCMPPYTFAGDVCWPGQVSHPGRAYIALYIGGGFCERLDSTGVSAEGQHIQVAINFSPISGCRAAGTLALPTASLISFSTTILKPGLYSVSYVTNSDGDVYRSESTYLSLPAPPPTDQAQMEAEAATALSGVIATQRASVFSVSRVDGNQLLELCSTAVDRPAYLVTFPSAPPSGPRQMTVMLAGDPARVCRTTQI